MACYESGPFRCTHRSDTRVRPTSIEFVGSNPDTHPLASRDVDASGERTSRRWLACVVRRRIDSTMPMLTPQTFDFSKLHIEATQKTNRAGGKYAGIGIGDNNAQVKCQLAQFTEPLRCPFGIDADSKEAPDKRHVKLELSDGVETFLKQFDDVLVDTAVDNSFSWFKKEKISRELARDKLIPNVKIPTKEGYANYVKVHIDEGVESKSPTEVLECTWKGDKIGGAKPSSLNEISRNCRIVPVVRIQGGVWFNSSNFGTKLYADSLIIIKGVEHEHPGASASSRDFDFGGVQVAESEDDAAGDEGGFESSPKIQKMKNEPHNDD